jgi:hypothetical protein
VFRGVRCRLFRCGAGIALLGKLAFTRRQRGAQCRAGRRLGVELIPLGRDRRPRIVVCGGELGGSGPQRLELMFGRGHSGFQLARAGARRLELDRLIGQRRADAGQNLEDRLLGQLRCFNVTLSGNEQRAQRLGLRPVCGVAFQQRADPLFAAGDDLVGVADLGGGRIALTLRAHRLLERRGVRRLELTNRVFVASAPAVLGRSQGGQRLGRRGRGVAPLLLGALACRRELGGHALDLRPEPTLARLARPLRLGCLLHGCVTCLFRLLPAGLSRDARCLGTLGTLESLRSGGLQLHGQAVVSHAQFGVCVADLVRRLLELLLHACGILRFLQVLFRQHARRPGLSALGIDRVA